MLKPAIAGLNVSQRLTGMTLKQICDVVFLCSDAASYITGQPFATHRNILIDRAVSWREADVTSADLVGRRFSGKGVLHVD